MKNKAINVNILKEHIHKDRYHIIGVAIGLLFQKLSENGICEVDFSYEVKRDENGRAFY